MESRPASSDSLHRNSLRSGHFVREPPATPEPAPQSVNSSLTSSSILGRSIRPDARSNSTASTSSWHTTGFSIPGIIAVKHVPQVPDSLNDVQLLPDALGIQKERNGVGRNSLRGCKRVARTHKRRVLAKAFGDH